MTDADDASARVERFAADVDAKLRQLRDDMAAVNAELATRMPVATPPPPTPSAPVVEPEPVEPAPVVAEPPTPPPPAPPPARAPAPVSPPRGRRWPRRVATALALVAMALGIVVVLAAAVGPALLPYDTYVMRSGSMAPAIPRGSLVIVTETDASNLGPGDIITFDAPGNGTRITHRIASIETADGVRVFVTKGDHNAEADPWRVRATGTQLRHRLDIPVAGYLFGALASPAARVALVAASLLVIAYEVREMRRRG